MGGNTGSCLNSRIRDDEFLQNQMKIYRWRSDQRSNAFLPRVTFRNGVLARKQQQFKRFIEDSNDSAFLDIEEFKEKAREGVEGQAEILIFERYRCTLEEINGILTLPQVIYTLSSLVSAFSSLNKTFKEVIVSRSCCFITKSGEVRAWINSNPKSNFIQQNAGEQVFEQRNYKGIAYKILSQVYKCSQKTPDVLAFFSCMRETVEQTELRSELFELLREKISNYGGYNRVPICNSIEQALKRKEQAEENRVCELKLKMEPQLNQTRISGYTLENDRSHIKSKSMESTTGGSLIIRNTLPLGSMLEQHSLLYYNNSNFFKQSSSNFAKIMNCSEVKATPAALSKSKIVKMPESLEKTEKPRAIMKLSDTQPNNTSIIRLSQISKEKAPSESLKISVEPDQLISGNLFTEKQITNFIDKNTLKYGSRAQKLSKNSKLRNVERKISIMDFQQEEPKHPKTYHEVISTKSFDQEAEQHPWKTNKTITRLITDNADSLVHSVGTSSQEKSGSLYSGVLAKMGRDITRKELSSHHSSSNE